MKIDLLDIETQYINNRNLNYAKKTLYRIKVWNYKTRNNSY